MKNSVFYVSRQRYWIDGRNVVECAQGGLDYANPDMLCSAYDGEGEEYVGLRPAVEAALKIAEAWRKDEPKLEIEVATGCTHGMTMPFEGEPDTRKLLEAADEFDAKLPRCPQCNEISDELTWHHDLSDEKFCSESCCDRSLEWHQIEDAVLNLSEWMDENEIDDETMLAHLHVSSKTRETYNRHPEGERRDWLCRYTVNAFDVDEIKSELEEELEL